MNLLFDIETNSLDPDVCHSLVIINVDTDEAFSYADQDGYLPIAEGLSLLGQATRLIGHNIQDYDLPALDKLYGFTFDGEVHDTLILSRLVWSDLKDNDFKFILKPQGKDFPKNLIGLHSLKAWGHRLGNYKGDFPYSVERFAQWSKEMQDYCEQDCKLNLQLYRLIMSKTPSPDSVKLEHDFAFVIRKQEKQGFNFDLQKANELLERLQLRNAELEGELQAAFPPWEIREPFIPKVNNATRGYLKGELTYKVKTVVFNPASRDHIADRLQSIHQWKPSDFTSSGKPTVDEEVLAKLAYPEAALLNEFLLINKRIGQLATGANAWLKLVKGGKIHGRVNTNGCATHRCTHSKPNLAQTPSVGSPYGTECRTLFHAPEGYLMVGADLSGLELRCLAHYMARFDDGAYGEEVVNGDVHTANQKAAGLPTRSNAKTFIYGFLYGAGPAKIGSIVGGSEVEGKRLISKFMKATPAIKLLRQAVSQAVKTKGNLTGLDGRTLPVRSQHAALNTLLQSAGAILSKRATVFLYQNLTDMGFKFGDDYALVAHVHDEMQLIAKKDIADIVGQEAVKAFELAGDYYNFRCPITGEYKTGPNWASTH